jgi:flagellar protein FliT
MLATMTKSPNLIPKYQRIAQFSRKMREAAELQNWNLFNALEKDCMLAITDLRTSTIDENLTDDVMPIRRNVLKQVLADDAKIRSLIQPGLNQILEWLSHPSDSEQK